MRLAFALVALAAIAAIAIPLATTRLVRESEADVRAGDLAGRCTARSARTSSGAAAPRLQQALVLEAQGSLAPPRRGCQRGDRAGAANWRTWFVLARIEAERGRAGAAVRDYRRARSLNPRLPVQR